MRDLNQKIEVNKDIAWQEIEGEILILDSKVNEAAHDLNQMGSYIFQQLVMGKTPFEVLEELKSTYATEINPNQIQEDFEIYINNLLELNLIKLID